MEPHADEEKPVPYYLRPNKLQRTVNEQMVAWIPELASKWAATPMANNRWLKPSEKTDRGHACYIAAEVEQGRRQDYIWMPRRKDLPAGYYHLATQESYIQINYLVRKRGKPGIFRKAKTKEERKLYRQIKDLLHNRLTTDEPDDVHAQQLKVLRVQSGGATAAAFGKAAYLPTFTSVFLLGA
jgi:hypothetical protein